MCILFCENFYYFLLLIDKQKNYGGSKLELYEKKLKTLLFSIVTLDSAAVLVFCQKGPVFIKNQIIIVDFQENKLMTIFLSANQVSVFIKCNDIPLKIKNKLENRLFAIKQIE